MQYNAKLDDTFEQFQARVRANARMYIEADLYHRANRWAQACDCCDRPTMNPENDYGEFVCDGCLDNAAEEAYERQCADFHAGDSGWPKTLLEQQIDARKFK